MSTRSHASAATTNDEGVDTKSRASVLAEYLAYQSVTERLAFPHPAKQPQLKAQGTEKWLDEWQASWEKLRRA